MCGTLIKQLTTSEDALELVGKATAAEPALTYFGVGLFCESEVRREHGTAYVHQKWAEGQAELGRHLDQVAIAADWIKLQVPIASMNLRCSSYTYKHDVERWHRKRGEEVYVSNGAFIAAAIGLGFRYQLDGPNVYFNFSRRALKASR